MPLAVGAACLALGAFGEAGREWGRYQRGAVEAGEAWRLVTAHLVHLGPGHLALNLVALALLGALFDEVLVAADWIAATVVSALAIDFGLYAWNNDVDWYVGLSGVLHGYVAAGAVLLAARRSAAGAEPLEARRSAVGVALLVGLAAKIAWEQYAGPIPFTQASAGGPVVVAAHLYGAVAGLAVGVGRLVLRHRAAGGRHAL